jgi:hypothetical protein
MSADNYYFIFKRGAKYVVQCRFASSDYEEKDKEQGGVTFDSFVAAEEYAHTEYSEYGVSYDFPTKVVETTERDRLIEALNILRWSGEDCWCSMKPVDNPAWHENDCIAVREQLADIDLGKKESSLFTPDQDFPFHVEGCICPRFKDVAPNLVADLTCPIHGVQGSDPGDKLVQDERKENESGIR